MTTKCHITAEDLYKFEIVSDPQISPDGRYVIFTVQRTDAKTEKKYSNLWLVATDGDTPPRQFTYGDQVDRLPRWSPDGKTIAFLSNRKNEKQFQLYLIPVDGGEARPLTDLTGSFANYEWSPDGNRFVAQFRKKDEADIEREKDEQKKKLGIVNRHITGLNYKMDGLGYLPEEKWHIWTIDAQTGAGTQISNGRYDELTPTWSPDGTKILFISNHSADPDQLLDETELYTIPADGGEMTQIIAHHGRKFNPTWSPSGTKIAYLGRVKPNHPEQNSTLFVTDVISGDTHNLSSDSDLHLSSIVTLTDSGSSLPQQSPLWSSDGQKIYVIAVTRGRQPILAFDLEGNCQTIISGDGIAATISFDSRQTKLVYLWGSLYEPGQVYLLDTEIDLNQPLTTFNEWLADIDLGNIKQVSFTGGDDYAIEGWITYPPDFDPAQSYPSIMQIHGGPMTQYGYTFMHEFYYLAAQGYVVYWANPRGSQGYGDEFAASIAGRWGTVDVDDFMAWADFMAAKPYIDPNRMALTGGSYGGYMTSLLVGKTNRFRTAVAQRVVSNGVSFYGSSDMNWFAENLFGLESTPWDDLDRYWELSPMRYIGNAQTPTLVIHGENDMRCHQEQGEQLYVALKRLGVDTELVLFPGASHGLSRNGRVDQRIARLNHIQRWFDKYLKD